VNRLTLMFLLFVAFGWVGVRLTAAQTAQPVSAQAPLAARLPARSVRANASGSNQTAEQPEQTKVARVYNGEGYFDSSLAENLRPILAKVFRAPEVAGGPSAPKSGTEISLSILGRGAPGNGGNQSKLAKSDQP
jgi:hypothetical protein